ncbi:hypothetical protein [Larkinella rosea]|uniref:Uncharacterized protein n=1 Tax=Larkinella rosea TaxID=2025312 RepID=A0A3P1BNE1_9BACT|nr:hypothetical protein [Larkinella rosea]RRB02660.1 hypothetical protein EHT25_19635 [Larkinella rosea]
MERVIEEIKYEKRVVAFIDILGFKDIIKTSESNPAKLNLIYESLLFLKNREKPEEWNLQLIEIEEYAQKRGLAKFNIADKTSCTCFSDSIVISVQIEEENINEIISTLITNLSFIGAKLMTDGILFRGAITIGNIIHKDNGLVIGQALIDAYQLELSVAKNPRIILSKNLLEKLNYPIETNKDRFPYHQYLSRFDDGCVGFHQMIYFQVLQSWTEMEISELKSELKKVKQAIIDGLDSSFEFSDIHSKFKWLKAEYEKLIILENGVKEKIHELNDGIAGQNIHYSYTDNFYYPKKSKKV